MKLAPSFMEYDKSTNKFKAKPRSSSQDSKGSKNKGGPGGKPKAKAKGKEKAHAVRDSTPQPPPKGFTKEDMKSVSCTEKNCCKNGKNCNFKKEKRCRFRFHFANDEERDAAISLGEKLRKAGARPNEHKK